MISFKSVGLAVAAGLLVLGLGYFLTGDHGPSSGLIRSAMGKEVEKRFSDAHVVKITFIRAGSFVAHEHRHLPDDTTFYPIRVKAEFTADAATRIVTWSLYFYRDKAGHWAWETNSF